MEIKVKENKSFEYNISLDRAKIVQLVNELAKDPVRGSYIFEDAGYVGYTGKIWLNVVNVGDSPFFKELDVCIDFYEIIVCILVFEYDFNKLCRDKVELWADKNTVGIRFTSNFNIGNKINKFGYYLERMFKNSSGFDALISYNIVLINEDIWRR